MTTPKDGADAASTRALAIGHRYDPEHRVVALTGVCGSLGLRLLELLEVDRRYVRLHAIDIRRPDLPLTKTAFHRVDLTQPSADADIARVLVDERVDTLVHLAFLSKPTHNGSWAHELEAIGTMHVLNAAAAAGVRKVIVGGLTAVYGANPENPNFLTEQHERRGARAGRFLRDKLEAERLARRFAVENPSTVVSLLRMASVLGPNVDNYVSRYFGRSMVPVLMGYDPLIQLLHHEDAVAALKLSLDADFPGEFNIAGDGVLPLSTALALAGKIPVPLPYGVARPLVKLLWMTQVVDAPPSFLEFLRFLCVVDTSQTKRVMGFSPRYDIRQTITDFAGTGSESMTQSEGPAR